MTVFTKFTKMSLQRYMRGDERRFDHTVAIVRQLRERNYLANVAGLGGGGEMLGIKALGVPYVDIYDSDDWFKPEAEKHGIRWVQADFNSSEFRVPQSYDVVLACQVLAHMERSPILILRELWFSLKPGGYLLLSTLQLHRLSQRVRMAQGKALFAPWQTQNSFVQWHLREYSVREIRTMLADAGFTVESWHYASFGPWWYDVVSRLWPSLSPFVFVIARR